MRSVRTHQSDSNSSSVPASVGGEQISSANIRTAVLGCHGGKPYHRGRVQESSDWLTIPASVRRQNFLDHTYLQSSTAHAPTWRADFVQITLIAMLHRCGICRPALLSCRVSSSGRGEEHPVSHQHHFPPRAIWGIQTGI